MPDEFKLINATKETACRTAEAEAIRAKTGGTSPLTYDFENDKGFADAIAEIPSGGDTEVKISAKGYMYIPPKLIYPDQTAVLDLSGLNATDMYASCDDITSAYFGKNIKWGELSKGYGYSILAYTNCVTVEVASLNTAYDMFWNARSLKTAIIKSECQSISKFTFEECYALTTVIIEGDRIITLANVDAFTKANNALIYVPDNLVDDYKSATNWSNYADRIFPMSDLEV